MGLFAEEVERLITDSAVDVAGLGLLVERLARAGASMTVLTLTPSSFFSQG